MRIDGQPFEIQVIGEDGKPIAETGAGYAALMHGEKYKFRFKNETDTRAGIQIKIDGTPFQKMLVIDANATADLETIPDTGKRLTFFAEGSDEASQALLDMVEAADLGVVSATFTRERGMLKRMLRMRPSFDSLDGFGGGMRGGSRETFGGGMKGLGSGGTGLSGHSNQYFASTTFNRDYAIEPVTINLRLAHDPNRRILDAHSIPGRSKPVENPVPPPVQK